MRPVIFPFDYGGAPVVTPPPPPPPEIVPTLTYDFPANGDAMPAGGYILPLFPRGWFRDSPNAHALFGVYDDHLDDLRLNLDSLHDAHLLPTAQGQDLDDLVALVGITRQPGESDDALRARAPATVLNLSKSSGPHMVAYLSAALGLPVIAQDGPTPGTFTITLIGTVSQSGNVMPLIRDAKAAGTIPSGQMRVINPTLPPGIGRVGTYRVGDACVGAVGLYIPFT